MQDDPLTLFFFIIYKTARVSNYLDTLFCIATVLNVSIDYLLIDSANKSDNFLEQMDSVARSLNPSAYNSFRKTVKILAEHIDEM